MITSSFLDIPFIAPRTSASGVCTVILPTRTGGGDTFDCYTVQTTITLPLNDGTGMTDPWVWGDRYTGPMGSEDWEAYTVGSDVSNLDQGSGWNDIWAYSNLATGNSLVGGGLDDFETYTVAEVTSNILNDGTNWEGPWIVPLPNGDDPAQAPKMGSDTFEGYVVGLSSAVAYYVEGTNYTDFTNWTSESSGVVGAYLNLRGVHGVGDGLYVHFEHYGQLKSRFPISFPTPGNYKLTLTWKGNGASYQTGAGENITLAVAATYAYPSAPTGAMLYRSIFVAWDALSTDYEFVFAADGTETGKYIFIDLISKVRATGMPPLDGAYLLEVKLENITTSTVMLDDNFDSENPAVGFFYQGSGWVGVWQISEAYIGPQAEDTFESYASTTGMNDGTGFTGAWQCDNN